MLEPYYRKDTLECGCDEAGRGCLAGPVVAAAVILDPDRPIAGLQDSKQLSASRRKELAEHIRSQAAAWAIGICSPEEIDRLNILRASFRAMHKAIDGLATRAGLLLIDGNRFDTYPDIPHICFVKGDGRYQSIAAASILAKTYRDQWMQELDLQHPAYGWNSNKGYPTKAHYEALELFGATPHHRKSFRLSKQLRLFE